MVWLLWNEDDVRTESLRLARIHHVLDTEGLRFARAGNHAGAIGLVERDHTDLPSP